MQAMDTLGPKMPVGHTPQELHMFSENHGVWQPVKYLELEPSYPSFTKNEIHEILAGGGYQQTALSQSPPVSSPTMLGFSCPALVPGEALPQPDPPFLLCAYSTGLPCPCYSDDR